MYCKKCGNIIDDDSIYCSKCGTKQISISVSNQADNLNSEPIVESKIVNVNLSFGNRSIPLSNSTNSVKISNYDTSYQKETEATIIGIIIFIITFLIVGLFPSHSEYAPIISIVGIIYRIMATVWVVNIAEHQNRDKTSWGIFAFFLPSIALIIIGLNKKIKKEIINFTNECNNEQKDKNIILQSHNQMDEEEFYGSTLYWILIIGIPVFIMLFFFLIIITKQ